MHATHLEAVPGPAPDLEEDLVDNPAAELEVEAGRRHHLAGNPRYLLDSLLAGSRAVAGGSLAAVLPFSALFNRRYLLKNSDRAGSLDNYGKQ